MTILQRLRKQLATRWPRASLRTYLALIMLIAALPVVVLMVVQIRRDVDERQQRLARDLERTAAVTAEHLERELAASIDALTMLARSTLPPAADSGAFERLLARTPRLLPNWDGVFLLDAQGHVLHGSMPTVRPVAPDTGDAPPGDSWIARLRAAPLVLVSGPVESGRAHSTVIAVPVLDDGELRYALGASTNVATWRELLRRSAPPVDGFLTLIDREHHVIADTRDPATPPGGAASRLPPAAYPWYEEAPPALRLELGDGQAVYAAWRAVGGAGWQIGVAVPAAPLDTARREALAITLAGAALCVALGLYFAFLLARHLVVDPLQRLAAHGPADVTAPLAVREVAALSDSLRAVHARDRAARQRLQATVDEFETLFAGSPTGLAMAHDPECRVVTRNAAMNVLFGIKGDAPADEVRVLQRGEPLALEQQPLRRAAQSGAAVAPVELELVARDGSVRHVLAQAVPLLDAADRPRGAIASYVDITDRVRSDARLRESQHLVDLAQEAGRVGFFRYHFQGDLLDWTEGQASLFGLDDEAPARDAGSSFRDWSRHIEREDRLRVERVLRRMFAAGHDKETLEYRVTLPDGTTRWLSSRVVVLYGANRRPEQIVGVSVDMTEEKLAQRERARLVTAERTARIEAEAASRAKDEFLAMLGHELRNPLSAIAAAIEVLNRVAADTEVAINARRIAARQTRHLAHMMDDLLDVGRVISGKVLLVRRVIDLAALARRVASTFEVTGESRNHALSLDLQESWVDADATRIEQVLGNLLSNAVKYTPAGSRIALSVRREDQTAVLRVADDGPGIAPALLPRIFELFVQGERSPDRRVGGLGVGLTLARRLVELHGGTISADSSGQGSTFEVRLPAVVAPALAAGATHPAPAGGRCVVLVEDNVDALQGLRTTLELDGHTVVAAVDGPSGLQAVIESRPDAAIVDIGLPGMTGLEVARRSRAAGYGGLLIALSGYGRSLDVQQAFAAGFDSHLVKPVDTVELQRLLSDA